jgi:DNA-binding transcriptional ArsR family regulator
MDATKRIAQTGYLLSDFSRTAMLWSLMGGESRPATELAMAANISPQNASNHLRLLLDANFLKVETLGRNKFYSLGGQEVAATLESMAAAFGKGRITNEIRGTVPPQLLFARTCYDHLAGELSVKILEEMSRKGFVEGRSRDYLLTEAGKAFFAKLGIDTDQAQSKRRRFAYSCLDWSRRLPHLAGSLGAALLQWMLQNQYVVRERSSRALRITDTGRREFSRVFSIRISRTGNGIAQA